MPAPAGSAGDNPGDRAMPAGSGRARTKNRVVRVSDAVWDAASARARHEGRRLSDVIRLALLDYAGLPADTPGTVGRADRNPEQTTSPDVWPGADPVPDPETAAPGPEPGPRTRP